MAIEIAMPTTPNFMRSTFRLHRAVGQTISPFTGTQKTQEYDYVGWSADVTLPPMRRSVAVNWQSWLTRLKGSSNFFQFADPDALTNTGTYDTAYLEAVPRVTNTSTTLTFSAANSTIVDDGTAFANVLVGDYIFITGANDTINNGTHKVSAKSGDNTVTVTSTLADETNDSACTIKQNVKGATGLALKASTSGAAGSIAVGDYLGVLTAASATSTPTQLLLVTEVSTETAVSSGDGKNLISVGTEPKLRADITSGHFVKFTSPKGIFRLTDNIVEWGGDRNSNYNMSFTVTEVI